MHMPLPCIQIINMAKLHGETDLEFIETKLKEILNNPEFFYKPQNENARSIKHLSQKSYSSAACDELFKGRSKALSKLLIDGFDEEQIWHQSDLLNKAASSHLTDFVNDFDSKDLLPVLSANSLSQSILSKLEKPSSDDQKYKSIDENAAAFSSPESSDEEDYAFDDDSDSATEFDTKLKRDQLPHKKRKSASDADLDSDSSTGFDPASGKKRSPQKNSEYELDDSDSHADSSTKREKDQLLQEKRKSASDIDEDSDSSTGFDTKPKKKHLPQKKSQYTSIVDDQFFKLSKLENFLRIEDLKDERGDEPVSDDDIDLFQDIPSDDLDDSGEDEESEDEENKNKKSARDFMYDDFFDDPESELENENNSVLNDKDESFLKEKDHSFDENESYVEMETVEKEENQQNEIPGNLMNRTEDRKTKFELEQEKTIKTIQEYEKTMLQPLPWHLTGEVAADKRPVNSLLKQETEFDSNTKQELLADKDLTEKIEEITIMAIRNKAFFDVERKYKPTEDVINYKKEVALEQTKSKKSLAEVYEEDYLKKQYKQNTEEEEDPKHKEIKKLMDSLLPQLHSLFSHIPKPAIPEIKIVSNLPAITVEEVAPTNVSDATLLAPEEVKKKTGVVQGKTERSDTDRKRERRKKKIHQRLKEKKKLQKLESQKEIPSSKATKLEKLDALKKIKQHKNTKLATVDEGGKIKSSKDFFSRLQDTVDTKNKTKNFRKKVKK